MTGLSARFDLPEAFCNAHALELLTWARDLQAFGPLLKIKLKRVPAGEWIDVLTSLLPVDVTLKCTLLKRVSDDEAMFVIEPATTYDREMIAIYVSSLPAIEKVRQRYIDREFEKRGRGKVDAAVERIPQVFVEVYDADFRAWGVNFGKSKGETSIVLREIPGAPVKLDDWGNKPMVAVDLVAVVEERREDYVRLLIKPADEQSEMLIRKHCEDIVRYGEPAARRAH